MTLMKSHDKNQVGIVFVEGETDMVVGQALHDHTEICIALDWLYSFVALKKERETTVYLKLSQNVTSEQNLK